MYRQPGHFPVSRPSEANERSLRNGPLPPNSRLALHHVGGAAKAALSSPASRPGRVLKGGWNDHRVFGQSARFAPEHTRA
jgi:hypothetical protein